MTVAVESRRKRRATVEKASPGALVLDVTSMVLLDRDGGQVRAVSYDSSAPLERTLKSFAVDLTEEDATRPP